MPNIPISSIKSSVSVIIPSLNEELNIANTIRNVLKAADETETDVEIIVINDGSKDKTGIIAEEISSSDNRIQVIHNHATTGLGSSYSKGAKYASKEYVTMIPGDDETPIETVRVIMESSQDFDLILTYVVNPEVRPLYRRILSRTFVCLVRALSGYKLQYFNGNNSIRRKILRQIPMESNGHIYMALTVVRCLSKSASYHEVGVRLQERGGGSTSAFKFKTILGVAIGLMKIFVATRPRFFQMKKSGKS